MQDKWTIRQCGTELKLLLAASEKCLRAKNQRTGLEARFSWRTTAE